MDSLNAFSSPSQALFESQIMNTPSWEFNLSKCVIFFIIIIISWAPQWIKKLSLFSSTIFPITCIYDSSLWIPSDVIVKASTLSLSFIHYVPGMFPDVGNIVINHKISKWNFIHKQLTFRSTLSMKLIKVKP